MKTYQEEKAAEHLGHSNFKIIGVLKFENWQGNKSEGINCQLEDFSVVTVNVDCTTGETWTD